MNDRGHFVQYHGRMSESSEELIFINNLCARTKELRRRVFPEAAEQMAIALGIPPSRYAKYETRTPMPHYLIPRFAAVTGESIEYVLTGRNSSGKARDIAKLLKRKT